MPVSTTTPTTPWPSALKQAGVKPKVMVFPTGYDPAVIGSPAWSSVQGGYFDTTFRPFDIPNAGTKQMQSALEKYEHFKSSDFPTFSQYESWLGADLMIKGLELGREEPDPLRRHQRPASPQELQRQRPAARDDQLHERLRQGPGQVVWLVHDRREERIRPGFDHADLRHGHPREPPPLRPDRRPPAGPLNGSGGRGQSSTEMAFLGQLRTAAMTLSRSSSGGFSSST